MIQDDAELIHQDHVLRSFNAYRYAHLQANNLRRQAYANLSMQHQALLPDQPKLLNVSGHPCTQQTSTCSLIACYSRERTKLILF